MVYVIMVFIIIVLWDMKGLLRCKHRGRIMTVYFILISLGLTIGILVSSGRRPTSPAEVIEQFIKILGVAQ